MSNIEYVRQMHHTKVSLKRTRFRVKEFYSVFVFCGMLKEGDKLESSPTSKYYAKFRHSTAT